MDTLAAQSQAQAALSQEHTRALSVLLQTLPEILTLFATLQSSTTTASPTTAKRPAGILISTLSRLTRKLAEHATPEIAMFLVTRFIKYGAMPVLAAGGFLSAWAKWLEPLLRSLFG
jgi:hypothetical protein